NFAYGYNFGTITTSYASGNVSVHNTISHLTGDGTNAGGLVGAGFGGQAYGPPSTITDSYALGNVSVTTTLTGYQMHAGGLIGQSDANVTRAYATGAVTAPAGSVGSHTLGGFIGLRGVPGGTIPQGVWDPAT